MKKRKDTASTPVVALNSCIWKKNLFIILVLVLPIAHFFVFWLYPNIDGILLAFKDMRGGEEYYTLKNFKDCFTQIFSGTGSVGSSFWNTMKFFAYDVVIFPLGIVWGYVFYKKIRGYNFFRLMFYVPSILSSVVVAGMFKYLINADGPIGVLWAMTHDGVYANFLQEEEYAFVTVLIYYYWVGFAGSLLLLSGAFAKIPLEVIESVTLDGCGWWTELWKICVPLIWPTLSTIIITTTAGFFFGGPPVLLLTGGAGNTSTISFWMYDQIKLKGAVVSFDSCLTAWTSDTCTITLTRADGTSEIVGSHSADYNRHTCSFTLAAGESLAGCKLTFSCTNSAVGHVFGNVFIQYS